ncbi:FecR family protein [Sandaracinus amylolyticus]|uniref:FecR family protein n=1 Tax=Sandaracinus amylolyticus TaxID=927083 RepID=UPI001F491DC8|nr:FecR family protein [Sandaracinus amylolyticus]UJR85671.1 Hypothetical protein I5071_77510 [Sandaracinus amylolyticus]
MSERKTQLGETLEVPVDEARLARGWRAIADRTYAQDTTRRRRAIAGGVVLAAAAAVLVVMIPREVSPSRPGPLATQGAPIDEAMRAAGVTGASVALDDGSVIAIAPGASLEPLENSGERFSLLLREGRARFDVRPGGPRRWTIEAGVVTVEVVGTSFEVDRAEDGVRVQVARGRVLVRGESVPDRVRSLGAGESIHVATAAPVREVEATPAEPEPEVAAAEPAQRRVPRVPVEDIDTLLERADEARRAGRIDEALEHLAIAAQREGDRRAAIASLTRGRLLLDHGRAAEAVVDLRRAIAAGLPPALEETAKARLVDALARSGDREGALRAAEEYLRAYPNGAWRASVSRAIGP